MYSKKSNKIKVSVARNTFQVSTKGSYETNTGAIMLAARQPGPELFPEQRREVVNHHKKIRAQLSSRQSDGRLFTSSEESQSSRDDIRRRQQIMLKERRKK